MSAIDKITVKGFKSIKTLEDFELKSLNVVVGANGSGKSNLISFFKLLRKLIDGNLNRYVTDSGGAGDLLFCGRKTTEKMQFVTRFGERGFRFNLVATPSDDCAIEDEARYYTGGRTGWWELGDSSDGRSQMVSEVNRAIGDAKYSQPVFDAISSWQIYHFHDTSPTAAMRHEEIVEDDAVLREDAANIAPFLLHLKTRHAEAYQHIIDAIQLVMPFFDDFLLKPVKKGEAEKVKINWLQKGSDYPMQPYHLSDGSIRFICLATALLQPSPPTTIIIDEPELGLHPAALVILAELVQAAAARTQVIIATQSPALIDQFAVEDIIVVNRKDRASHFERLCESDFDQRLQDYSVGELWAKNVIVGGPSYE